MKRVLLITAIAALLLAPCAFGQLTTQTSKVSVNVAAEAALSVPTDASLASTGTNFADYTGTSTFNYFVRTAKTGGTGNIQLKISSDFGPAGGPSVASPLTTGDALTYTATVASPATAATGSQTSSTTASTGVATFGADAHSAKAGNSGSVNWTLTNDPAYATGSYTATVTWTISAT